ncbi:MAG TPA: hypothetical protein VGM63_14400 [Mucilaginibacter sp.]|jgi:hypothetical protein
MDEVKIAKILFWVNLLPAIVASIVAFYMAIESLNFQLRPGEHKSPTDYSAVFYFCLLVSGIFCEVVYYSKSKSIEYALKRTGWVYSILINIIFIALYIWMYITSGPVTIFFLCIYPIAFLVLSCIALKKTYQQKDIEI